MGRYGFCWSLFCCGWWELSTEQHRDDGNCSATQEPSHWHALQTPSYLYTLHWQSSDRTSDRTDLSTESGSGPIQLARDRYRAARRSVADSLPHCMNEQKIVSYYTQSHTRRKESGETEHSVHGAEAESPSISTCHVAAHASGLGERDHRRHTWWASVFRPPWSICGVWTSV